MASSSTSQVARAFQVLGVTPQSLDQIRSAPFEVGRKMLADLKVQAKLNYRKAVLEYHPDRTGGDTAKADLLKTLNQVFADLQKLEVSQPSYAPPVRVVWVSRPVARSVTADEEPNTWVGRRKTVAPRPIRTNARHVVNMSP